jgi:membrane-associated phospholipid phosphatase
MIKSSVAITTSYTKNNIHQHYQQIVPVEIEPDGNNNHANDEQLGCDEFTDVYNNDNNARSGNVIEQEVQPPLVNDHVGTDSTTPTFPNSHNRFFAVASNFIQRYSLSHVAELLLCLFFLVFVYVTTSAYPYPMYQRPIPFQKVQNDGNDLIYIIKDLTMNESLTPKETVTKDQLFYTSLYGPLSIQLAISLLFGQQDDVHGTVCVYILAYSLVSIARELLKSYVGYLRPIFYSLCHPSADYMTCQTSGSNSHRSFPSGHASTAFVGLTLFSLYIHTRFGLNSCFRFNFINKIRITVEGQQQQQRLQERQSVEIVDNDIEEITTTTPTNNRNTNRRCCSQLSLDCCCCYQRYIRIMVSMLSLVPIGVALFIAVSRLYDNKHFPADVVSGAILGASVSLFVHGLWIN